MNYDKKISFNKYEIVFLTLFSVLLVSHSINSRNLFELIGLFFAFYLLSNAFKIIFLLLYSFYSVVHFGSYIANVTFIYYLLSLDFVLGNHRNCKLSFNFVVQLIIVVVVYFAILDILIGFNRPVSLFNSPLALGYFLASCSIIMIINSPKLSLPYALLPLISGSRSSTLLLLPFFLKKSFIKIYIFTSPFLLFLFFYFLVDYKNLLFRSLSFHGTSDSIRFNSWMSFFNLDWDLFSILFGFGRINFGSLGYRLGGNDVLVIESSLLTLISSYGFVFPILWLFLFIYSIVKSRSFIWSVFLIVSSVSVFHDSLAVIIFTLLSFTYASNSFKRT